MDAIRLDDYVHEHKDSIRQIDLIKLDIEGAELDALQGAQEVLKRYRPRVIMELDSRNLTRAGRTPQDVLGFWENQGYSVFSITDQGEYEQIGESTMSSGDLDLDIYCVPR